MADDLIVKPSWGAGRVAFLALLDTVRAEVAQGLPLTVIFGRHKAALGVSYSAFCKLVARYANDAKPRGHRPVVVGKLSSPALVSPARPVPLTPETQPHARHEPAGRRDFRHHGIIQEGEPEQLFGPGFLPKRRS